MRVFFIPVVGDEFREDLTREMPSRPWQEVREMFVNIFGWPVEDVERDMDGRGRIERLVPNGMIRYVQED